jgi:hypothetical protein
MIVRGKFEYNDDEGEGFSGLYCQVCDGDAGSDVRVAAVKNPNATAEVKTIASLLN